MPLILGIENSSVAKVSQRLDTSIKDATVQEIHILAWLASVGWTGVEERELI